MRTLLTFERVLAFRYWCGSTRKIVAEVEQEKWSDVRLLWKHILVFKLYKLSQREREVLIPQRSYPENSPPFNTHTLGGETLVSLRNLENYRGNGLVKNALHFSRR